MIKFLERRQRYILYLIMNRAILSSHHIDNDNCAIFRTLHQRDRSRNNKNERIEFCCYCIAVSLKQHIDKTAQVIWPELTKVHGASQLLQCHHRTHINTYIIIYRTRERFYTHTQLLLSVLVQNTSAMPSIETSVMEIYNIHRQQVAWKRLGHLKRRKLDKVSFVMKTQAHAHFDSSNIFSGHQS